MSRIVCVCVCMCVKEFALNLTNMPQWRWIASYLQLCNLKGKIICHKKGPREDFGNVLPRENNTKKKNWIKNCFYTHIQNILIFSNVTPHSNTSLHALQFFFFFFFFFFFKWQLLRSTATFSNRVSFPATQKKKKKPKHGPPRRSWLNSTLQSACEPSLCRSTAKPLASYSTTTSQRSVRRISTFEWGSVSSSWLELEGEGVADLLPGGEGEPWGSALRLTWGFSWVSALMGLGSIEGELFIRGWLRAGS